MRKQSEEETHRRSPHLSGIHTETPGTRSLSFSHAVPSLQGSLTPRSEPFPCRPPCGHNPHEHFWLVCAPRGYPGTCPRVRFSARQEHYGAIGTRAEAEGRVSIRIATSFMRSACSVDSWGTQESPGRSAWEQSPFSFHTDATHFTARSFPFATWGKVGGDVSTGRASLTGESLTMRVGSRVTHR